MQDTRRCLCTVHHASARMQSTHCVYPRLVHARSSSGNRNTTEQDTPRSASSFLQTAQVTHALYHRAPAMQLCHRQPRLPQDMIRSYKIYNCTCAVQLAPGGILTVTVPQYGIGCGHPCRPVFALKLPRHPCHPPRAQV